MKQLPVRHEMSLRPKPFAAIVSGMKTYELRLNDEKRRRIHVGDEILFSCTDSEETVLVRVVSLQPFADFSILYDTLPLLQCGYTEENVHRASPSDMDAYYPPEKQAVHGVLAIGVERCRFPVQRLTAALEVRELTPDDVTQMLRIARGNPMYYQYMKTEPTTENLVETLTALPPRRTMADKHFFGWFREGRMVAFMDLILHHPKTDMAFIGWFMVDAQEQGRGFGRKLIDDVLLLLADMGVREVRLGRINGNPQSERFWKACCFADTDMGYETDGYTVKIMTKQI